MLGHSLSVLAHLFHLSNQAPHVDPDKKKKINKREGKRRDKEFKFLRQINKINWAFQVTFITLVSMLLSATAWERGIKTWAHLH